MLGRIINNAAKQIRRSGWVAWSSVAVMTLAFFVATIFGGLAYMSNLYVKFIETRDNVLVFFEVGTDKEIVNRLRDKWSELPQIRNIGYTSEEEAYNIYLAETAITKPVEHEVLRNREKDNRKLHSSLDIQLYSLNDIDVIRNILLDDIETELESLGEYNPQKPPIFIRIDDQALDELREVFGFLRIGGAVILGLLFVIIFFFTLMTVEFRTFNRMEEIGVMQLVGGSLWYIRAPYILEGGFYGMVGALISALLIGGMGVFLFVINRQSTVSLFIYERISILDLPVITVAGWGLLLLANITIGFLLGTFSSYLAIRRYIK